MLVIRHFKQFNILLRLYQIIGLTPILTKTASKLKRILYVFPVVLTSILGLLTAIYLIVYPQFEPLSSVHTIINVASKITITLITLTANYQCFCYKSEYQYIIHEIRQIEKRVKFSLKVKVYYVWKVAIIFSLFVVSQGLVVVEVAMTPQSSLVSSILTSSFRLIHPLSALHVILFSDIVTMFILTFTEQIRNSVAFSHSSSKIRFLKNIKLMHMDLWKLVTQINIFFGWTLLFLTINSFLYITYKLYWIFLSLELEWGALPIIESAFSLLYGVTTLFILVNSCQSSSQEMKVLIESIEMYAFWASDNAQLHHLKQEVFSQMVYLPIVITGSGFFTINRQFLAGIAASCCMYIIIFIQFFMENK